jgi:hypothetical protein
VSVLGLSLRPGNRHHDAVGVAAQSRAGWTIARVSARVVAVGRRPGRWSRGQRRRGSGFAGSARCSPSVSCRFLTAGCFPPLVAGGGRPVCRAGRAADRAAAGPAGEPSGPGQPARAAVATVVVRRGRLGGVAAVRKMVLSVMNCGARVFMAGFEDGSTLMSGNLVTGHLNLRNALLREISFSAPGACAQGNRGPGRGRAADGYRQPGGAGFRWPRRWSAPGELMPADGRSGPLAPRLEGARP